MLKLEKEDKKLINGISTPIRTYRNTITGNDCTTYLLHRDRQGNQWWTFEDLFALPFIRQLAAKKVLDLYGHGLSLEDVKSITAQLKTLLRTPHPDRDQLVFAKVHELENLAETMADPIKQCMGLCTVYLLLNDEMPDAWTQAVTSQKMTILSVDIEAQSFFLNWWTDIMRRSGQALKGLSQIASTMAPLSGTSTAEPSTSSTK